MLYRIILAGALLLGLVMSNVVSPALAHGLAPRGEVIGSAPVNGATGNCSCVWQWYTVGLHTGRVNISVTMHGFTTGLAPTYGIRVYLMHGESEVTEAQTACYTNHGKCAPAVHLSAVIKQKGPYYVRIEGPGANTIRFTLRVSGAVYGLRCARYC